VRVAGGVGGTSSILKSGWNALRCSGTSAEVLDQPGRQGIELGIAVVVAGISTW